MRRISAVLVNAALVVGVAAPALAEGDWDSYFTNWSVGANTRQWYDNNGDNVLTSAKVRDCTYNWAYGREMNFKLLRYDAWTPDENMGTRDYNCVWGTEERDYYSDVARDDYYLKLNEINDTDGAGWMKASADFIRVWY